MAADALKWALAAFFLRENVKVLEIKERKDGNTYTFEEKRGDFSAKCQKEGF